MSTRLWSGIALFGARGYDGVTTRELAHRARTNISSIKYHFGGKEALYRAVLEEIIHEITELVGPLLLALRNGVAEANGNGDVLTRLARQFAQNRAGRPSEIRARKSASRRSCGRSSREWQPADCTPAPQETGAERNPRQRQERTTGYAAWPVACQRAP